MFYAAAAGQLRRDVDDLLAQADTVPDNLPRPKAIIAPHAGYIYSGPIAARAYARLAPFAGEIERVVLFGPSHRMALAQLAVPTAGTFATPLGDIPIDREGVNDLLALRQVIASDRAHAQEHSLEVHLPFLQRVLGDFRLIPVVVGDVAPELVAEALDQVWGGDETLIVVSTDLSHFLDYRQACARDGRTAAAIERLEGGGLGGEDACGCRPLAGLLHQARNRGLDISRLDLRNSGDTAGDHRRVVGYGAWTLYPPEQGMVGEEDRRRLVRVAAKAIRHGLETGDRPGVGQGSDVETSGIAGCFVTLKKDRKLRGCVGTLERSGSISETVAWYAWSSAFGDRRFTPLTWAEFPALTIEISLLGEPEPIRFDGEADLLRRLRPGIDGVLLTEGAKRATFLPQVWDTIRDPQAFLRELKIKAGLKPDYWSDRIQVSLYQVEHFGAAVPEDLRRQPAGI